MPTPTTPTTAAALGLLALAMLAHVSVTEATSAQKCFVCSPQSGGSADDLRDMFPGETLPSCDHFRPEEGNFVRECPPEYRGCLTATNGTHVTRTCSLHAVDDCKFANRIRYCYCGHALCNRATDGTPGPAPGSVPGPVDDEDLSVAEGSGAGSSSGTFRQREPHTTASSATPHATPASTPSHGKSDAAQRTDLSCVTFAVVLVTAFSALV